ncbi:substrate-binding domain-containing protein [Silicimonas algicola]|uniref:Molybdate transport system substrate-binding protein n=1 Tax=Silicimonas algicola TaxID=1826607 RepID=A0A316GDM9_9RHOB|nr:substrate-binding domain-containing protein [Silicimonas algicola]PWK59034.1 molybdate transport system substrate-binding protein [Silicimonas algicola]
MSPTASSPRPLRIITSGAQAAPIETLLPGYDGEVEVSYGSSLGEAHDSIPTRLAKGERFDLYFLAEAAHARYSRDGLVSQDFVPLVASRIGAAVREGAPVPDISTSARLKDALLAAGSVAHAASASGIYLSTEVFPALGIADEMKDKARTIFSERVGRVVARGDADLGFQQMSELLPIPGITIVGPLPPDFARVFVFGAAYGLDEGMRPAAEAFLEFLRREDAAPTFTACGLDPIS